MKKLILIIILCFVGSGAFCEDMKKATIQQFDLSFEQAYDLMLANNNALKALSQEIKQKNYERKSAIGHYFPKVGLNTTYLHFANPIDVTATIPMLGSTTTNLQQENLWMASAGVCWNIFTGGKIIANHKAAIAKLEGTSEKYRMIENELTSELVKRYFGLRLALDVVTVRKQLLGGTKHHYDDAKKLEKEGIIAKSERFHAEVAYTQAQRDYDAALRDANIVEEGLKSLIKEQKVDLTNVTVNPNSLLFLYKDNFLTLDEFKKAAIDNNPQLKQAEVKKKLAQAKFRSEVANYSPTVSLFAYDIFAAKDLSQQVPRWAVGGTVNFLLFDGLSRYNNVRAADEGRKIADYEKIDAEINIESLVTKQYQELHKYKEQFESTNKSVESAKEALRTTNLGFKEGFKTSLEVVDAELALSGVKIDRLKALYNYDTTLCDLLKTTGSSKDVLKYISNSSKEKL